MAKYEITLYNKQVRSKVEAGEHHQQFQDAWADFRYIEMTADNEDQVRDRIERKYPETHGFVIENIRRTDEFA